MDTIDSFSGSYAFLSNFFPSPVTYGGHTYPTNEHAFQAAKCTRFDEVQAIQAASTPGAAKRLGRRATLRPDWETTKIEVMTDIVFAKFRQSPRLTLDLFATSDAHLEEGNRWGDTFWGTCHGNGRNVLGYILMEVRSVLREECHEPA